MLAIRSIRFHALHRDLYWSPYSCGSAQGPAFRGRLLNFEEQILMIAVAPTAAKHRPDVAVDGFDLAERHLDVAGGEDALEVTTEELGDLEKSRESLPA